MEIDNSIFLEWISSNEVIYHRNPEIKECYMVNEELMSFKDGLIYLQANFKHLLYSKSSELYYRWQNDYLYYLGNDNDWKRSELLNRNHGYTFCLAKYKKRKD